jgi:hypothetical protein
MKARLLPLLVVVSFVAASAPAQDKGGKKSSPITVKGASLTFDPKTCTQGQAGYGWALGSVSVKVLGHRDGHCEFEVTKEIEGGYMVYLCRVPVDSGPVTIEGGMTLKTSFPFEKSKLIRGGNVLLGAHWLPLDGTDKLVHFRDTAPGKGGVPDAGAAVRVRMRFYKDGQFKDLLQGAKQGREIAFTLGSREAWKWLHLAVTEMKAGGKRQVWMDPKTAEGMQELTPGVGADAWLCVELELLSVAPAKK